MPAKTKRKPKAQPVPAVPYEPTAKDVQAVAAFKARQEQGPANVGVKVTVQEGGTQLCVDYPDQITGEVHLMTALGVTDTRLSAKLVTDLVQFTARGKDPDELELNRSLSIVRGIGPTDTVEALLAVQMAAVHNAAMASARQLAKAETIEQQDSASNSFNKLMRTFAAQVEALKRHRSAGEQNVIVKHVHVYPGGQAVVGNVKTAGKNQQGCAGSPAPNSQNSPTLRSIASS